jgi:soluble lytic murein transglycosylase
VKSTGGTPAANGIRAVLPVEYSFTSALRMERWEEALALIDAQSAEVRQRPEVRYACAAAAERGGDHARVVALLAGLENELPLLANRIRERRARAALSARKADVALEYYRQQPDAEGRLRAAESLAVLGDHTAARATLQGLLAQPPKRALCAVEARAHRLLSELYPDDSRAAVARELRWLALSAPLCASSDGADERLEALGGTNALDKRERAERARVFAESGQIERTERELTLMASARGPEPDRATVLALRGTARLEARRELDRAAELLLTAAAMNQGRRAEWLYAAARTQVRAGKLESALALFDEVRRKAPRTALGEQAEYKRAQLTYSMGRFEEAARAYDVYLARYGERARFLSDAKDERAVSWVMTDKAKNAAVAFAELARASERGARARYLHLEAVAWLKAGDRSRAEARFREVTHDYPFSFAALAASERLEALGVTRPLLPASASANTAAGPLSVELPAAAQLLHAIGLDREAELALAEAERSVAQAFSGQADRALCSLYQRLASAERAFRIGQGAATFEELNLAPRSDRRWLWDCVYPRPYAELVERQSSDHGIEAELIYAVMRQESGFRPEVVSPARAVGLLQIMPSTGERLARELGVDFAPERLREPPTNVRLGALYLRKLLDLFDGNLPLAVASYNAGPNAVLRWLDGGRSLDTDLFVARIPYTETRGYVERVLSNYVRYRYLTGGDSAVPRLSLELPTPKTDGVELY